MIEEKDPRQESVKSNPLDDEVIIDLTEEVIIKSEDGNVAGKTTEDIADQASKKFEDTVKINALNEPEESQNGDPIIDPQDSFSEDQDEIGDDQIIASAIEESFGTDEDEHLEMTTEHDLEAADNDDVIIIDNTLDEADESINDPAGGEIADNQRMGGLFEIEENVELEHDLDEDEDQLIEFDDERAEDNQDFVNLVLGGTEEIDQNDAKPSPYLGFTPEEQQDINALDDDRVDGTQINALDGEEPLKFDSAENLFDFDEESDFEDDEEVIPLDGLDDLKSGNGDDMIEITEFDQYFPADNEALPKQSSLFDVSDEEEEDFLELIDVEEDEPETAATKPIFSNGPEDELPAEKVGEPILDEAPEEEKFDFNLDQIAFSEQFERLDAFLSEDLADEPEVELLPVSQVEEDQTGRNMDEPLIATPEQIDAALERIITKKYSGKIESIIYAVIEKAVAKEIDRLKGALTGTHTMDDKLP